MKTLLFLSALVLLAFQVQADPTQEADEETKTEKKPGKEDPDVAVSFGGPQGSAFQDADNVSRNQKCYYTARSYRNREGIMGTTKRHESLILCCR
uniref:Alpha-defensin N-terminal domain-containing protein n=1 Tax=Rattus norvegicus TaxID=10116 RepID=A0ABK0LE25_RAT